MLNRFRKLNVPGILIGDIALVIFFSIVADNFLSGYNFLLILRNTCTLLIAAMGMTMAVLISQIDMSIGSVVSMSAVLVAILNNAGAPLLVTILVALCMGALVGLINGVLIGRFKFDFWVVTFSSMSIVGGLALVVANGATISTTNAVLNYFGNGKLFSINVVILVTALIVGVMIWVLSKTKFGYNIYSIGGSEVVAELSGVKVVKNRILVFICSGVFAAFAGLMIASMTSSGSPTVGVDYSFNAMAAVVIGGTSFAGGKGGLTGTVCGTLLLRILASGLSLMGISSTWQKAIIGIVILALIVTDVVGAHRKGIRLQRRVYQHVD